MPSLYVIGSLRNPQVPIIGNALRDMEHEAFDNWFTGGPGADDAWRDYERSRGHSYQEALDNHSARHIYGFDRFHLNRCHGAVLTLPAGRSGHLEAGFFSGLGKPVFMLLDTEGEPERLDVMTQFLYRVCSTVEDLCNEITAYPWPKFPELPMITAMDAQWLVGVWEGDGTICLTGKVPRISLQMTDRDTIERAARLLGSSVWRHPPTVIGKPVWACGRSGLTAIEWLRILRPYFSSRRQAQIVATVQGWLDQRSYNSKDRGWWETVFHLSTRRH